MSYISNLIPPLVNKLHKLKISSLWGVRHTDMAIIISPFQKHDHFPVPVCKICTYPQDIFRLWMLKMTWLYFHCYFLHSSLIWEMMSLERIIIWNCSSRTNRVLQFSFNFFLVHPLCSCSAILGNCIWSICLSRMQISNHNHVAYFPSEQS